MFLLNATLSKQKLNLFFKLVTKHLKDPSNLLFISGSLIVVFFVLMSVLDSPEKSFLVEAGNYSRSGLAKREYEGTIWSKFYITVPKAEVDHAQITTNVDSKVDEAYLPILEKSAAHYQGSAYPGQKGNVFVYGHSVLPQFFNPKAYRTIFSRLYKVEVGDIITVEWGNDQFKYVVVDKKQVDPKDLKAVSFNRSSRVLTLMTCDPPGTYFKRLLIEAEQVGQKPVVLN